MAEGIPILPAGRVVTTLRALPSFVDEIQMAVLIEQAQRQLQQAD